MDELEKRRILETYTWIKVKKYVDDPNLTWEERYAVLKNHHDRETVFLTEKIREMIAGVYTSEFVPQYVDDESLGWQERYEALLKHHEGEAEFLIAKVRGLVAEV